MSSDGKLLPLVPVVSIRLLTTPMSVENNQHGKPDSPGVRLGVVQGVSSKTLILITTICVNCVVLSDVGRCCAVVMSVSKNNNIIIASLI